MKVINTGIFVIGLVMLFAVAAANSYIAFADEDYTGGMFAASAFWTLIGSIFIALTKDRVIGVGG